MARPAWALTCAVTAAAAALALGSGVAQASAPSVTGKKYSEATAAISGAGMQAVVATTVGDQKAWPDCLVSNERERTEPPPENSAGAAVKQVLVSLNCDAGAANSKAPGYSAASPEAKTIKAAAKAAAKAAG